MNRHALLDEDLNLARDAGDDIPGIGLEQMVQASRILMRPIGSGGQSALLARNGN